MASNRNLLVLPGDGIGPEVMNEVRKIIACMGKKRAIGFDINEDLVGGAALDKHGVPLSDDAMKSALEADAVLFGSVGGPKWDTADFSKKPERGLLRLTLRFTPQRAGTVEEQLAIVTDDAQASDLRIALRGFGVAPLLEVEPEPADFGPVFVGVAATLEVRLRNAGGLDLDLQGVTPAADSDPAFDFAA